jgi:hypothetical protein
LRVDSEWAAVELDDREGQSNSAEPRLVGVGVALRGVWALSPLKSNPPVKPKRRIVTTVVFVTTVAMVGINVELPLAS